MRIDEAIARVRRIEASMRGGAIRCAERNGRDPASLVVYQDAEALETVCNALETANVVDVLGDSAGDGRNGAG